MQTGGDVLRRAHLVDGPLFDAPDLLINRVQRRLTRSIVVRNLDLVLNEVLLSRDHLTESQVHEFAVVEPCGFFLHGWLDRIQTVLSCKSWRKVSSPILTSFLASTRYLKSRLITDHKASMQLNSGE